MQRLQVRVAEVWVGEFPSLFLRVYRRAPAATGLSHGTKRAAIRWYGGQQTINRLLKSSPGGRRERRIARPTQREPTRALHRAIRSFLASGTHSALAGASGHAGALPGLGDRLVGGAAAHSGLDGSPAALACGASGQPAALGGLRHSGEPGWRVYHLASGQERRRGGVTALCPAAASGSNDAVGAAPSNSGGVFACHPSSPDSSLAVYFGVRGFGHSDRPFSGGIRGGAERPVWRDRMVGCFVWPTHRPHVVGNPGPLFHAVPLDLPDNSRGQHRICSVEAAARRAFRCLRRWRGGAGVGLRAVAGHVRSRHRLS